MTKDEIRMQAQLFALQAEMYAKVAQTEGMKAENMSRQQGNSPAYSEYHFDAVRAELQNIADRIRSEGRI